ncbi:phosphatidic acid phosphatase type 2/haloperoxidase [Schizothecium vesticola]|uniref:Phosphatidic acid phosphatase type 2/haloperoxidase n=1 Tax=Schizothecium vesticola TaxID=314040 RepID=A0AA40EHB2_9PEZI|nr:phosphatidic acid phosphatase type 2/haloperoxidase [Schizothecium vesticola]
MRFSVIYTALSATVAHAAYSGDIVQYWVEQSSLLVNGTIIGGLASPPSSWATAAVQGAVLTAAVHAKKESLAFQQLAVSHAAHNALIWLFHGTRNYNAVDASLRAIIPQIGLDPKSDAGKKAVSLGRASAAKVAKARADDGLNDFVDYVYGNKTPGIYQTTPGGNPIPDTPQAPFVRPWAGLGDITPFRGPPPLPISDPKYEADVLELKEIGAQNSTKRTAYQTDTAYFWRESSVTAWNRLAHSVIGSKLATDVPASAKFYAQFNYALANAALAGWATKYAYSTWRPVTAIQRLDVWLPSGRNVSDASWGPLLRPTPSHPDYVSGHSTFGGAAAAVIRAWNGGDVVDAVLSSNVTLDGRGVITRRFTSLKAAAEENSKSRVYGGIHFNLAGFPGITVGENAALATLKNFDKFWDQY